MRHAAMTACIVPGLQTDEYWTILMACRCRRNAEGSDELFIPLEHEELQRLLDDMLAANSAQPATG